MPENLPNSAYDELSVFPFEVTSMYIECIPHINSGSFVNYPFSSLEMESLCRPIL